jgi:hypothetical protein
MDVNGLALSPDGKHLLVSEWNAWLNGPPKPSRITIFDTTTWKMVRRLSEPEHVCGPEPLLGDEAVERVGVRERKGGCPGDRQRLALGDRRRRGRQVGAGLASAGGLVAGGTSTDGRRR